MKPTYLIRAGALLLVVGGAAPLASAQTGGTFDLTWNTFDGGGGTSTGGTFELRGTIGQHDAALCGGGSFTESGGFWDQAAGVLCYPDCNHDHALNVNDFVCFQAAFAGGNPVADCDHNAALNVNDFICFQAAFAAGCSAL